MRCWLISGTAISSDAEAIAKRKSMITSFLRESSIFMTRVMGLSEFICPTGLLFYLIGNEQLYIYKVSIKYCQEARIKRNRPAKSGTAHISLYIF